MSNGSGAPSSSTGRLIILVLVLGVILVANLSLLSVYDKILSCREQPLASFLSTSALPRSQQQQQRNTETEQELRQRIALLDSRLSELSSRLADLNLSTSTSSYSTTSPASQIAGAGDYTLAAPRSQLDAFCDANFGWGLVDSIRHGKVDVCHSSKPSSSSSSPQMSVQCYQHHGRYSAAQPSSFCDMHNVALDGAKIRTGEKTGWAGEEGHLTFTSGALSSAVPASCGTPALHNGLASVHFQGPYIELFATASGEDDTARTPCDVWIDDPVVALTRNEWAHLLFSSCELVNAFMATHLAQLDPKHTRILLLDSHPQGPFFEFFKALSKGGDVLQAVDLLKLGRGGRKVCFRRLVTSIPGYNSFLVDKATGDGSECRNSPMLKAWRNTLLDHLGLLSEQPGFPHAITLISRRPYQHEGFKKSKIGRVIGNEDELSKAMKEKAGGAVNFQIVDLAPMSLRAQVAQMRKTSVLVGMHGAGLVQALFLPDDAMVIEIFPKSYGDNHRDRNIARHMGHIYMSYELESPEDSVVHVDPKVFVEMMDSAIHIAKGSFGVRIGRCGFLHC